MFEEEGLTAYLRCCVGVVDCCHRRLATVPEQIQLEGAMMSSGGGPVADGAYDITVSLFPTNKRMRVSWTEGPASLKVTSGRLVTLGGEKAIKSALFAKVKEVGWRFRSVKSRPGRGCGCVRACSRSELGRRRPSAALAAQRLSPGAGAVAATKVGFTYAGSKTKAPAGPWLHGLRLRGGAKFDGDPDPGNSVKAKNGVFTGSPPRRRDRGMSFVETAPSSPG